MQNTSIGSKDTSKQLHNLADSMRDSVNQASQEYSQKAKQMASDAQETAGQYYEKASSWLEQNYGKTASMVGVIAAAGIIGYLIGRNNKSSQYQGPMHS